MDISNVYLRFLLAFMLIRPLPVSCVSIADIEEYVNDYVVTSISTSVVRVSHNRPERSESTTVSNYIRVKFFAFDRAFDFVAIPVLESLKANITIYRKTHWPTRYIQVLPSLYSTEKDCKTCVQALGYLVGDNFNGIVSHVGTRYYVENAKNFQPRVNSTVTVYRDVDLNVPKSCSKAYHSDLTQSAKVVGTKRRRRSPRRTVNRIFEDTAKNERACEIELVSDHTLYEWMNRDDKKTATFLYLHAKFADSVFRRTDFGTDTIRIIVGGITIYTDPSAYFYPFKGNPSKIEEYLLLCSSRLQEYCLSVCVCAREFEDDAIGVSFKAEPDVNIEGGICTLPQTVISKDGSRIHRSPNTAAITTRKKSGKNLPLGVTSRSFVHEMGHSFGSEHDPLNDFGCTPGGSIGFFVMHSKSQPRGSEMSQTFSQCSIAEINRVINIKGSSCLRALEPVCGNGIREGDEECDCGRVAVCPYLDPCCTPKGGIGSDKGCTFRRSNYSVCSPAESPCCTHNCWYIEKKANEICYSSPGSCVVGKCSGASAACTESTRLPDGSSCMGKARTCSHGSCNSTVCVDNGLGECICAGVMNACKVCCRLSNGTCVTAASLGFAPRGALVVEDLLMPVGTRCLSGSRQCDLDGVCSDPTQLKTKTSPLWLRYSMYIYLAIGFACVLVCVGITVFCVRLACKRALARKPNRSMENTGGGDVTTSLPKHSVCPSCVKATEC